MHKYVPLLLIIFLGCNERPIGDIRGELTPRVLELSTFTTFTEDKNVPLGSSANLIFGMGDGYESRALIKFQYGDTSYTGLDEIKLMMRLNDEFENDTLAFSIHILNDGFVESEANWSRRNFNDTWQTPGGDFETDSLRAGIVEGDSIVLYFNYVELEEILLSEGIIIITHDTGFVHFESKEGGDGPKLLLVKNDATVSVFAEADCHIVLGPEPALFDQWVGSGWAYRNFVKFNYDSLLDNTQAIYGELTFECSEYFSVRDSIHIGVRELTEPFSTFDTPTGPLIALTKIGVGDTVATIDIVKHVQRIIEHPDSNFGIYIGLSPETYDISRVELIPGSHRLIVGYVEPPDPRW
ncbi:hypothetical protein AMJ83_01245 [candidate division WOR_3 bacterium SM23_42]|uniref:DNRLRE domain-containing protein n=1 Tax=candidate division WOR_3 bacterium SM23_42 TaxID=1703779 RepID=A0A0S8FVY1_UNCW3|nr:MAG: hypothetical protein AMJ83_01245 [candidate division WOR_3 bacterium SM23_42]